MKRKLCSLLIIFLLAVSLSAFSQAPPPPNGNGSSPVGGSHAPVGADEPMESGVIFLLLLGAMYGSKKIFQASKPEPNN